MSELIIDIEILPHANGLELPAYQTEGAAGMDLPAAINEDISLAQHERIAVPTGLKIAIPAGYEVQIRPRSGLVFKYGLSVANAPGTIDCDYRGEVKILLINLGSEPVSITRGMRIAQMVVAPVSQAELRPIETLPDTVRGVGGFGSTGKT